LKSATFLSVIIPAYNAERTIGQCLESILQSIDNKQDIEIIIVDDGSTDNTWQILENFQMNYREVHAFHKVNGGVGSARNFGLKKAMGKYIAWVDADDYVSVNWYPMIVKELYKNPDLLFFDYFRVENGISNPCFIQLPEIVSLNEYVYEQSFERELKNFLWNQILRADILKQAMFNESYHMLEDYDVYTQIIPMCKDIIHIKSCLYYYVRNEKSLTHNVSEKVLWNNIIVVKHRYDRYTSLGLKVSLVDLKLQLLSYLYPDVGPNKILNREKRKKIKEWISDHEDELKKSAMLSKMDSIKFRCFLLGTDNILMVLISIKRKLFR